MSSRTTGSSFMSEVTSVLLLMTCEYLREVEQRRALGGGGVTEACVLKRF